MGSRKRLDADKLAGQVYRDLVDSGPYVQYIFAVFIRCVPDEERILRIPGLGGTQGTAGLQFSADF